MAFNYNMTLHELMDFFCTQDYEGFTEQEIQTVERRIGVKLPASYRNFLLKYGEKGIYDAFNNLFHSLKDIMTSYQIIDEILENLAGDFEKSIKNGKQEEYADNPYFSLWQMPKEDWHTITQNYVLIGCDREGLCYEGYLFEDLLEGNPDPPLYLSCDDDFIQYKKWSNSLEPFLIEMMGETAFDEHAYDVDYYDPKDRISVKEIFAHMKVDIDDKQFKVNGHIGTCLDTVHEKVYFYFNYDNFQRLFGVCKDDFL